VGGNGYTSHDAGVSGFAADFGFDLVPGGDADNVFAGERVGWGVDSQLRIGRLDIWAEYLQGRFEPRNALPSARVEADGAYIQATCFVVPQRVQAIAKWDRFDPRRHAADNALQTYTVGINYFVKGDDIKFQIAAMIADPESSASDTRSKVLGRSQIAF
jgi:hypothetical protein